MEEAGQKKTVGDASKAAAESNLTCCKIIIASFMLLDVAGCAFALWLLLSRAPNDDEEMVLLATMISLGVFVISVLPTRAPPLCGPTADRIMIAFISFRALAVMIAVALVIRFQFPLILIAWLSFHCLYLLFAAAFFLLSKTGNKRSAVTSVRITSIEEANSSDQA